MAGVTSKAVVNAIHSEKGGILYEDTQGDGGYPILGPHFLMGLLRIDPLETNRSCTFLLLLSRMDQQSNVCKGSYPPKETSDWCVNSICSLQ